jgi:hypothetical protein
VKNPDTSSLTDTVVATPDPPSKGVHNPIHDTQGADAAGYAGALVAGVRTYGWAARTITRVLGDQWLSNGWVDYRLKRPLFAGEVVTISVIPENQTWRVSCTAGEDQRLVLDGTAGLGDAPWLVELSPPKPAAAGQTEPPLPGYTLATVPLNTPLTPLGAWVTNATAQALVTDDLSMQDSRYTNSSPTPIHPYFLAGRIAPLTRHNFTYGPTIHVRSQIQHRREALSERELVVGAQIVDAYDRHDHWYQVLDGIVTDSEGEVARIRHHTIFRPRGT